MTVKMTVLPKWVWSKVDGQKGWKWTVLKVNGRAKMDGLEPKWRVKDDSERCFEPKWTVVGINRSVEMDGSGPLEVFWTIKFDSWPSSFSRPKTVHFRLDPPKWPWYCTKITVIFRFLNNGHFRHTKMTVNSKKSWPKWPLLMPKITVVVSQNGRYIYKRNWRSFWGGSDVGDIVMLTT